MSDETDEISVGPERKGQEYTFKVAICVPCGDMLHSKFAYDLAIMLSASATAWPDIKQYFFMIHGSLIPKMRDNLVTQVLQTDATHMLFLDSDMRFPKHALAQLLSHNVEAVCASYHERSGRHRPVAFKTWDDFDKRAWTYKESTGLEEIAACGCGMMLIATDLLRWLEMPRFAVARRQNPEGFVGEDVWFCQQIAKAGAKLYLDHDLTKQVRHIAAMELWAHECVEHAKETGELPSVQPTQTIFENDIMEGLAAAEDYEPSVNGAAVEGA